MIIQYFEYNGVKYYNNTIVKVRDTKLCKKTFECVQYLKFVGIKDNKYYQFCDIDDWKKCYNLLERDFSKYIYKIEKPILINDVTIKVLDKSSEKTFEDNTILFICLFLLVVSIFALKISDKLFTIVFMLTVYLMYTCNKMKKE